MLDSLTYSSICRHRLRSRPRGAKTTSTGHGPLSLIVMSQEALPPPTRPALRCQRRANRTRRRRPTRPPPRRRSRSGRPNRRRCPNQCRRILLPRSQRLARPKAGEDRRALQPDASPISKMSRAGLGNLGCDGLSLSGVRRSS